MVWTKDHHAFAVARKIPPAAYHLWQWLLRLGDELDELEPDLREFNEWVEKERGRGYCRDTLKNSLALLAEIGVVKLGKKYHWHTWNAMCVPLDYLKPKAKNSRKRDRFRGFDPRKAQVVDRAVEQQQHDLIENVKARLLDAGIRFQHKYLKRICKFGLEKVEKAIALFHHRGGRDNIHNPPGWLTWCLREEWWEDQLFYCNG